MERIISPFILLRIKKQSSLLSAIVVFLSECCSFSIRTFDWAFLHQISTMSARGMSVFCAVDSSLFFFCSSLSIYLKITFNFKINMFNTGHFLKFGFIGKSNCILLSRHIAVSCIHVSFLPLSNSKKR